MTAIEVLVAVHSECIFNPRVKSNAKKIISKFQTNQVYYVFCDSPILHLPKNLSGEILPNASDINRIYVIGMLRRVCLKKHVEFLTSSGYGEKICYIDQAIQG